MSTKLPDAAGLRGNGTNAGRPWDVVVTINGICVPGGRDEIDAIPEPGFIQMGTLVFAEVGEIFTTLADGRI